MKKKRNIILGSAVLLVVVAVVLGITLYNSKGNLKPEAARVKVENFVNTYLMQNGAKATVSDVTEAYGLYKMKISIGSNQTVDSYVSRDGKLFFPQALDVAKTISDATGGGATATNGDQAAAAAPTNIPKTSKPTIELFVMSYCPYGTQMEKGILPAIAALGKTVDFKIKFNDYAMHGDKELKENMVQYCIQKEQTSKYDAYLSCFLKASDSASCLASTGIDTAKNDSCVTATDKQFNITANAKSNTDYKGTYPSFNVSKEDNAKYNVGGSPTLIINGTEASAARDSASLLKTICSAFETAPEECKAVLSSASPAAGFGEGTTAGGSAAAGCGQ
jgi:Thioredoxin